MQTKRPSSYEIIQAAARLTSRAEKVREKGKPVKQVYMETLWNVYDQCTGAELLNGVTDCITVLEGHLHDSKVGPITRALIYQPARRN